MPVLNGQGESSETPIKQKNFAGFLTIQMTAAKSVMRNPTIRWIDKSYYRYFDIYSGRGTWGDNEKGSPLIFLDAIEKHDIPYRAAFIDKEPQNIERLQDIVPSYHKRYCQFLVGDNKMVMRPWLRVVKEKPKMGLIYADPTGTLNWDLLIWLGRLKSFERTDFLIYLGANRGLKLHRRRWPERHNMLSEYIKAIEKSTVLVREPQTKYEWIFLYLTKWAKAPEWKAKGWYRSDTSQGRECLYRANFTKNERRKFGPDGQLGLFDI